MTTTPLCTPGLEELSDQITIHTFNGTIPFPCQKKLNRSGYIRSSCSLSESEPFI